MSEILMIKDCKKINSNTRRITFEWDVDAKPGQFVMIWAPGMEEIPLSLSGVKHDKSVTFKVIGPDTEKLAQLNSGDRIQIRGPYGRGYTYYQNDKKKILLVGGGIGIAPLIPLMKARSADIVLAGRTAEEVEPYVATAKNFAMKHWESTDDGSLGFHGNAVDLVKEIMKDERYDEVVACGPEIMLYFLHQYLNKVHVEHQMSLERHMKCGCGVCGACMMDDKRVCKDGPVFNNYEIDLMPEFGTSKRGVDGSLIVFRK